MSTSIFPDNFLWGAATSAHQVEGGNHNDWTEWERLGQVHRGEQSGAAADHYQRFRQDFSLAKDLGHNAHRLSFEWSRIEPEPGQINHDAIAHYHQVIDELRRLGLEPFVSLHHFTNPVWIAAAGGWTNRQTVKAFACYAELMAKEFGAKVKYWVTINEPTVLTSLGYLDARWPPQRKNYLAAWTAIRHLLQAHTQAYRILHQANPNAQVGVANNLTDFVAARRWHPADHILKKFSQYWHNDWWLNRTTSTQDFIGLNYYFHQSLRWRLTWPSRLFAPEPRPGQPTNDLGWEIHPAGLGRVLDWLRRYQRPIFITENGLADAADHQRQKFICDHLLEIRSALAEGIDIRGYLHWSLLDNFEWAEGFGPRFGLVAVDYATQQRTPRQSARYFQKIAQSNGRALDESPAG